MNPLPSRKPVNDAFTEAPHAPVQTLEQILAQSQFMSRFLTLITPRSMSRYEHGMADLR